VIPAWCGPYIGLPFADHGRDRATGLDCWGLVRLVYAEVFGLALPSYSADYTDAHDQASVSAAVAQGLQDGWQQVYKPSAGDLLILRIAGRPWHCGMVVTPEAFLHQPDKGHPASNAWTVPRGRAA